LDQIAQFDNTIILGITVIELIDIIIIRWIIHVVHLLNIVATIDWIGFNTVIVLF
jgi:hypothetical protein